MIPIGAYQPKRIMRPMHMNQDEAVRVFFESRCRRAVAMRGSKELPATAANVPIDRPKPNVSL